MSILINVIKEEKERIERNEKIYQMELDQLPKGSVVEKQRGDKTYYYLSYRENGKTKQQYLKMPSDELIELKKQIETRRRLKKALRNLQHEKKLAERMIARYE